MGLVVRSTRHGRAQSTVAECFKKVDPLIMALLVADCLLCTSPAQRESTTWFQLCVSGILSIINDDHAFRSRQVSDNSLLNSPTWPSLDLPTACAKTSPFQKCLDDSQRSKQLSRCHCGPSSLPQSNCGVVAILSTSLSSNLCLGVAAGLLFSMLNKRRSSVTCLGSASGWISTESRLSQDFHLRRASFAVADVPSPSFLECCRQVRFKLLQVSSRSNQQEVVAMTQTQQTMQSLRCPCGSRPPSHGRSTFLAILLPRRTTHGLEEQRAVFFFMTWK